MTTLSPPIPALLDIARPSLVSITPGILQKFRIRKREKLHQVTVHGPDVVNRGCDVTYTADVSPPPPPPGSASIEWSNFGIGSINASSGKYSSTVVTGVFNVSILAKTFCPDPKGGPDKPHLGVKKITVLGDPCPSFVSASCNVDFQRYVNAAIAYLKDRIKMNSGDSKMQELKTTLDKLSHATIEYDPGLTTSCGETSNPPGPYTITIGDACTPLAREFLNTLIHEACHVECHGRLDKGENDADGDSTVDDCDKNKNVSDDYIYAGFLIQTWDDEEPHCYNYAATHNTSSLCP